MTNARTSTNHAGSWADGARGITPNYLLQGGFEPFRGILAEAGAQPLALRPSDQMWRLGEFIETIFYIDSGMLKTSLIHEDGYEKILYFHGAGSIWPSCQKRRYRIELSLVTSAITPVKALALPLAEFRKAVFSHKGFSAQVLEHVSQISNIGIFETGHQPYNTSFTRLCNILHLISQMPGGQPERSVNLSQKELSEVICVDRTNVARSLSRLAKEGVIETHHGWLEVVNPEALARYCTMEVF